MKKANINVNGVTPLMQSALIAQYDAIVATINKFHYASIDDQLEYGDWICKGSMLAVIAHHDPRKGAE